MDPLANGIAAGALLLSLASIVWQAVTAYRRRRRVIVEVLPTVTAKPTQPLTQETWTQVHISTVGGTFSTREVHLVLPHGAGGLSVQPARLGPDMPDPDTRALIERLADPMHVRRTIQEGEQVSWVWRATGGPGQGIQRTGGWIRARVVLTTGKVYESPWVFLQQDDPDLLHLPPRPPRPRS